MRLLLSTGIDENLHNCDISLRDPCLEESLALGVPCVNVRLCIDQDSYNFNTALQDCSVEDWVSLAISCVNIRPGIDENSHNFNIAPRDRPEERQPAAWTL